MKLATLLWSLSALIALCSCSGLDILNSITPRSGYTLHRDIAYGENPRQKLNVYVPDHPAAGHPVIVFFYGGSWQRGSKADYHFVGQAFASKGFTTVIADYRLYPEVYFPAFMEDGASAFVWTHEHISEYGGNPNNLFVSGHSSGAYIAVLLTLDRHYISDAGGQNSWVKGAAGISGPYDFVPSEYPNITAVFSKVPVPDTQPIHYVRSDLPPILLVTGDKDTEVIPQNTLHLSAKLREIHAPVTERIYPGVGHVGTILPLARGFRGQTPVLQDIDGFVQQHTK